MSYSTEVLADTPGAYFRMHEASGLIQDSSGNANHAVGTHGAASFTYSQAGGIPSDASNNSILFNASAFGTNDHATLDLADIFTLEAWVKLNGSGLDGGIVSKQNNAYYMRIVADKLEVLKSNAVLMSTSTSTIPTSGWHHLVATKSGATVKLYIDNVDVTGTVTNATCIDGSSGLQIGSDLTTTEYFDHYLDEVAVYPTALSIARIAAHFNAATSAGAAPTLRVMRSNLRW